LNIAVLEAITALQPPPNDTQQSFTTRLLTALQFFVEIALEITKIQPIKREPSPTPTKIHLDHTLPFWKQSRCRRHQLTTPNDP
jgi:hypothetical protein